MRAANGRPAVFLDRDGTLNRDVDYLADPDQLEVLEGVAGALRRLAEAGFALVVVTNQSGIARGLFDEATLSKIHARLRAELGARGVTLDAIEYCPHHPTIGGPRYRRACACRKPKPGLLERAAARLGLDFARSWVIGDAARDLAAGAALGIRGILVGTGKGRAERRRLELDGRPPEHYARDLEEAADIVLDALSRER